ncbi:MAG: sugar phosphate isomerase/epimerase [Desulfobacterales bacterium]|nr:sugar phosphate isomerase/epimerase [Desulfobacterales bacterium]
MVDEKRHMLGISTCWWHGKVNRGDEIVDDILQFELEGVELEYRITHGAYEQMKPRLKTSLPVLSIHNFFPIPQGLEARGGSGNLFLLSSPDREERSRAIKYTLQTIEHADYLKARAVVLHLGRVDMPDPTEKFSRLSQAGKMGEDQALAFLGEQRQTRLARRREHLDAVLFSLEKLNREAEKRGIFLGIENRYHFHEIPDFEEIGVILKTFQGGRVGYWHDIGHARVQENIGIVRQKDLLRAYSEEMIGIHLHDVKGLEDHLAPGEGEMDYEEIKPFLNASHIRILEVHPRVKRKDLLKGIQFIRTSGI